MYFLFYIETKNQWARDDPAFLVLLMTFLVGKKVKKTIEIGRFLLLLLSFIGDNRSCSSNGILRDCQTCSLGCFDRLYTRWIIYFDDLLVRRKSIFNRQSEIESRC